MADYGGRGVGNDLRDALMAYQPGAVYPPMVSPPASGAPQPTPPVPLPPPRPQQPVALPPGGVNMPPTFPQAQQLYQGLQQPISGGGNYLARLGLPNNFDRMVVPPYGLPPDRNTIDPNTFMPLMQNYRARGQENI